MRTLTSVLIASLLGLSSTAFAAEPTTRDARMAEAMKDYQSQKTSATAAGTPAQVKAAPAAKKQHVTKTRHVAKKAHAPKRHARASKAKGASVKAAPAAVK